MSRNPNTFLAQAVLVALLPAMFAAAPVAAQSSDEQSQEQSSSDESRHDSEQKDASDDTSDEEESSESDGANDEDADLGSVSTTLRTQILLERAHFSPGVIDGQMGGNTRRALEAYQAANDLTVSGEADEATIESLGGSDAQVLTRVSLSEDDVSGPFRDTPEGTKAMSEAESLPYESLEEKLAEQFHVTPKWLRDRNPDVDLKAGAKIIVPRLLDATDLPKPARIVVDESDRALTLEDDSGRVIAHFPVTTGSEQFPLPIGEWKVTGVATDPVWYFDPELIAGTSEDDEKAEIPPGPNNPVGVVWIDLSKEHYGIHGTPEPSQIGKTASNGCIRMTNWSALALSKVVETGMAVEMRR